MNLLERLEAGLTHEVRGICSGGTPPDYDNYRWGGPSGGRIPQEVFPATFRMKKETDINIGGAGSTNTITLDPSQTQSSFYTLTNAGSGATTVVWPGAFPGHNFIVYNNSGQSATLKVTGQTGVTVVTGAYALLEMNKTDIVRVTPDQGAGGGLPQVTTYTGTTDAVLFPAAVNVAIFTSTGPDLATLALPGAGDVGKILFLVNTNTTQTTVTTTANKILNGTASTYDTLTAPAHAGAVAMLVATNGFWNVGVLGTGTWVLSEV